MNTKEFISVMRKIIREEVRAAVRQELNEGFVAKQKSTQNPQAKKPNINTGNKLLDEVLSETVVPRGFGSEGPAVSSDFYPTEEHNEEFAGLGGTAAFVKDYSAVLRRADEISKNKI